MSAWSDELSPLALYARLLKDLRIALESDYESDPERWIRIARAEKHTGGAIAGAVIIAVSTIANELEKFAELVLHARDILEQLDPAKALTEVGVELLESLKDYTFRQALMAAAKGLGADDSVKQMLEEIAAIELDGFLKYVPGPEDIVNIEQQLFYLLCVVYDEDGKLDLVRTGKLRLLQWIFQAKISVYKKDGLGVVEDRDVSKLGIRRLPFADTANDVAVSLDEGEEVLIGIVDQGKAQDLEQLNTTLYKLGYGVTQADSFDADAVKSFQKENALPLEKNTNNDVIVGNETINRLLNLDFGAHRLARAKPYNSAELATMIIDAFELENWDAEDGATQFIGPPLLTKENTKGYRYYQTSRQYYDESADAQPWITDVTPDPEVLEEEKKSLSLDLGFVALESRHRNLPPQYMLRSERQAAFGRFFFCANDLEPGIAGRFEQQEGTPQTPTGAIMRMYQWIDLQKYQLVEAAVEGRVLVWAEALVRVLYQRSGLDRAQIALEQYKSDAFQTRSQNALPKGEKRLHVARSPWFPPNPQTVNSNTTDARLNQINDSGWELLKTPLIKLDPTATALVVLLAGKHHAGYDTDAYFDNVCVKYAIIDPTT